MRLLMDKMPQIKLDKINGETFIEQIMKQHTSYYKAIQNALGKNHIHGMVHITGGGIEGNLCRIIPDGLAAEIDLSLIRPLPIFSYIQKIGNIDEEEMLATFNCGVGLVAVVPEDAKVRVVKEIGSYYDCYEIGWIAAGERKIMLQNHVNW